jgi:hypothetical protein
MTAGRALIQLSTGFILARAVYAAAKLGIADLLDEGPRRATELAEKPGVNADALFRIKRLLASAGILKQSGLDLFALTELGEPLRTASSHSMRDYIITPPQHGQADGAG